MKSPFGTILITIRDDAAVSAIVGTKVSAVAEDPPSVRLRSGPRTRLPFGPGSGRIGMQLWTGIAQCYGTLGPTGEIQAEQLAGLVSDSLHGKKIHGSAYIARVWTPEIGEILRDPDTDWPYHTVRIEAYAAAQVEA